MDITDLISDFNQYTLFQKKMFLDWIELSVENDEEARIRFLESLKKPDHSNNEQINEAEIDKRLDLLMKRIRKIEKPYIPPNAGPGGIEEKSSQERCKLKCINIRSNPKYQECVKLCNKN